MISSNLHLKSSVKNGEVSVGRGSWVVGPKSWVVGSKSWVVGSKSWVVGSKSWVVGSKSWVVGRGLLIGRDLSALARRRFFGIPSISKQTLSSLQQQ